MAMGNRWWLFTSTSSGAILAFFVSLVAFESFLVKANALSPLRGPKDVIAPFNHSAHHLWPERALVLRDLELVARDSSSTNNSGQQGGSSSSATSNDFTCGPNKPCVNGACCGESGWCGYSPTYCGTGCQSNCDAKAECGQYAATPGQGCPLNVCCSQFGFCGTTSDFCGTGCQSNCEQPKPAGGAGNVQQKIVGYWEGWNYQHPCGTMSPTEIPVNQLTHLNFAFGYIQPDFSIGIMNGLPVDLLDQVTNMKQMNPNLKVSIALGGWTFTDPGTYREVFSDMVSSPGNRNTFINKLLGFLSQYGFDGVDFDWEYPGADDRGGRSDDGVNYTHLFRELRQAVRANAHGYIVTFTAPTSYWYLRHFDLTAMTQYVDWINLMAYDLHGIWDANDPIGSQVLAHTNLTEIDLALDLFWRTSIDPAKIVLGLGFYGRSFKLTDSSCWKPGCAFSGPGDAGPCTATPGILSYKEIVDIISQTKATPYYDDVAAVNYFVYNDNSWISWDDKKSFQKKIDYANKVGLAGLMVWAVDLDDTNHDALNAITGIDDPTNSLQFENDDGPSISHGAQDSTRCKITACEELCEPGWTPLTRMNEAPGGRCNTRDSSKAAYLCCPSFSAPDPSTCQWQDQRSTSLHSDCNGQCGVGQILVTGGSFGWQGDLEKGHYGDRCGRGAKAFCCDAGNMAQYLKICRWTPCSTTKNDPTCNAGETLFTYDTGGPSKDNDRCPLVQIPYPGPPGGIVRRPGSRALCCPSPKSLLNCGWKRGGSCSQQCGTDQITIDTDPSGGGGNCGFGRDAAYCCDPPGGLNRPFTAVSLDKIFPSQYLPPSASVPDYTLTSFGGAVSVGIEAEDLAGLAFFLVAGSSIAVSRMAKDKRDGKQYGMSFIECSPDVVSRAETEPQTQRVICTTDDFGSCFAIREGGVKGTLVEMPSECGGPFFVRAISLVFSMDQTLPEGMIERGPTTAVFDFTFDFDMKLLRRDAGSISVRVDYSNLPGYWSTIVNSPGVQGKRRREVEALTARFFSPNHVDWANKFNSLNPGNGNGGVRNPKHMVGDLNVYFFDGLSNECPAGTDTITDEIAAGTAGSSKADTWYGFSMVATIDGGNLNVHQSAGFFLVEGSTEVKFKVGGIGQLDTSAALQGPSLQRDFGPVSQGGHTLNLKTFKGFVTFDPYLDTAVRLTTSNSSSGTGHQVAFEGYMEASVQSDFYGGYITFPDTSDGSEVLRREDQVNKGQDHKNEMVAIGQGGKGTIAVTSIVNMGLSVTFQMPSGAQPIIPEMSIHQELSGEFTFTDQTDGSICLDTSIRNTQQAWLINGGFADWPQKFENNLVQELEAVGSRECFTVSATAGTKLKRQGDGSPIDYSQLVKEWQSDLNGQFTNKPQLTCGGSKCTECLEPKPQCCGCADLFALYGPGPNPDFDGDSSGDLITDGVSKREVGHLMGLVKRYGDGISTGRKPVSALGRQFVLQGDYPSFPTNPTTPWVDSGGQNIIASIPAWFNQQTTLGLLSCTNWNIVKKSTVQQSTINGQSVRTGYNTEHVLEGQTIGIFFNQWLQQGYLTKDPRLPGNGRAGPGQPIRTIAWLRTWMATTRTGWNGGAPPAFQSDIVLQSLVNTLGGANHPDRLAMLLVRVNGKKAILFKLNRLISPDDFGQMQTSEEQLLYSKEVGNVFTYMAQDDVWSAFCGTYNDIRSQLSTFSAWYNLQNPNDIIALHNDWTDYIRATLDIVVLQGRSKLQSYYLSRLQESPWMELRWAAAFSSVPGIGNMQNIKLSRTDICNGLPPTTV